MAKLEIKIDCSDYIRLLRQAESNIFCLMVETPELDTLLNILDINPEDDQ